MSLTECNFRSETGFSVTFFSFYCRKGFANCFFAYLRCRRYQMPMFWVRVGGKYAVPCHSPLPLHFSTCERIIARTETTAKISFEVYGIRKRLFCDGIMPLFEAITRASHPLPSFKEPNMKISRITPERRFQKQLRLSHRFAFEITYTIQFACSDPQTKRSDSGIWLKHVQGAWSMELNRIELFFAQTLCWSSVKSLFEMNASFFQQCVVLKSYLYELWLYVTYRLW